MAMTPTINVCTSLVQASNDFITKRGQQFFIEIFQFDPVVVFGYAETGSENNPSVILLHGWPYDIRSFAGVAPLLASAGYRVIILYLRGYEFDFPITIILFSLSHILHHRV